MVLTTSFTEVVGCQVPLQLAPMGPVSTPDLAVAVADEGGVGSVTAQWLGAVEVDEMLAGIAAQTTGAVAANFVTSDIDREAVEAAAARAAGARVGTRFVATDESGAHPAYKQAVVNAVAGSTEITGAFRVCPLCATVPRARVVRSCIDALAGLPGDTVGEATMGGERVRLPKGHGLPPGSAATGHIEAMPMYAGESAAAVETVEPVASVIQSWCAAAEGLAM